MPLSSGHGQGRVEREPGVVAVIATGIAWSTLSSGKNCGPEIKLQVGPMIDNTWPGVKVLTFMQAGLSNVTLKSLVVRAVDEQVARRRCCPVPRCSKRAGRVRSGSSVFWIERRLKESRGGWDRT